MAKVDKRYYVKEGGGKITPIPLRDILREHAPKKIGRPVEHVYDPKVGTAVAFMNGRNIPRQMMADMLGMGVSTMEDLYGQELKFGMAYRNAQVVGNIYDKAMGDGKSAVAAAIFILKTQLGWKESTKVEIEQQNKATEKSQVIDASYLSPEEREILKEGLGRVVAARHAAMAMDQIPQHVAAVAQAFPLKGDIIEAEPVERTDDAG
jgi:hypothetical protein